MRQGILALHTIVPGGIDQAQAARGQNDDVGDRIIRLVRVGRLVVRAQTHAAVPGARLKKATQRTADRLALVVDGLGEEDVEMLPVLVHVRASLDAVGVGGQLLHQLLQRHTVALFEGRAFTLAVIGQQDDVVGTRRMTRGALQTGELSVQFAQHVVGVLRLDAGVMGHLVIPNEGRIGRRHSGEHVADEGMDVQLAHDDGGKGSQHRVDATALLPVHDGRDSPAPSPAELPLLQEYVPHRQQQRPAEVVRIGKVGAELGRAEARKVGSYTGREQDIGRVAGEHVAPAGAPLSQQAVPIGILRLEPSQLLRVGGRYDLPPRPIPPTKGHDVLVVPVQNAGLAGGGLTGEIGFPTDQPVAT